MSKQSVTVTNIMLVLLTHNSDLIQILYFYYSGKIIKQ